VATEVLCMACRLLGRHLTSGLSAKPQEWRDLVTELTDAACQGQHTYAYTQALLSCLAQSPNSRIFACISQVRLRSCLTAHWLLACNKLHHGCTSDGDDRKLVNYDRRPAPLELSTHPVTSTYCVQSTV
jgi:hypothetical protein